MSPKGLFAIFVVLAIAAVAHADDANPPEVGHQAQQSAAAAIQELQAKVDDIKSKEAVIRAEILKLTPEQRETLENAIRKNVADYVVQKVAQKTSTAGPSA